MSDALSVFVSCLGAGVASGLLLSAFHLSPGPVAVIRWLLERFAPDAQGMDSVDSLAMFLVSRGLVRLADLVLCPICLGTWMSFGVNCGVLLTLGLPIVNLWWSGVCTSGVCLVFYLLVRYLFQTERL